MIRTVKPSRIFSDQLLSRYRQQGDAAADAVILALAEQEGREGIGRLMHWLGDPKAFDATEQPALIQDFLTQHAVLPTWANRRQMEQGMAFFRKHASAIALILGCYSLPYCYAGADGARVLWLSQRIHNDTQKRLYETGEWVFGIMRKTDWTSGKAMLRTLKIRLLHAAVRWFTLQSQQWDQVWGYPVNQEDMAATNLAFSYVVIQGLRKMGISMSMEVEEAYLHHLNVTGHLLGVADELLPLNLREAYHLEKAVARRQMRPSEQGRGLTNSLLQALENLSPATLRNLPAAQMRFFLGDELADLLAVPLVPLEKRLIGFVNPFIVQSLRVNV